MWRLTLAATAIATGTIGTAASQKYEAGMYHLPAATKTVVTLWANVIARAIFAAVVACATVLEALTASSAF